MTSTLSVINLSSAEILTQITGQEIQSHHLTHRVMFLASLSTVLVGVSYADEKLDTQEKIYLKKILSQFVLPESSTSKMIGLMLQNIARNKIYMQPDALKTLVHTLSNSEKVLMLGLGCKLATVDGSVEESEKQYLRKIAQVISIDSEHLNVLLSCLAEKGISADWQAIEKARYLLDPQHFQNIDPAIVKAASYLCSKLPKQANPELGQARKKPSYEKLESFQGFRGQLSAICDELAS
ncbi:MAG: TerB family tellurite resistance protein, partial [Phormidesmis sp. RL_2_1]|nr:TerB family tellurite resistance protein [Phormidesmis sp. RL_2_1]